MQSYHYGIWAGGWNPRDAEESRNMLNEIREVGEPVTLSFYLAVYSMIQWASSEYREASRNLSEAVSYLLQTSDDYLNPSLISWVHQIWSPSSLLFWESGGKAFREFRAGIAILDKNVTNIAQIP